MRPIHLIEGVSWTGMVYALTNKANGKQYVGRSSKTAHRTVDSLLKNIQKQQYLFSRELEENPENFRFEILDTAEEGSMQELRESLQRKQQRLIDGMNTADPHGYNAKRARKPPQENREKDHRSPEARAPPPQGVVLHAVRQRTEELRGRREGDGNPPISS